MLCACACVCECECLLRCSVCVRVFACMISTPAALCCLFTQTSFTLFHMHKLPTHAATHTHTHIYTCIAIQMKCVRQMSVIKCTDLLCLSHSPTLSLCQRWLSCCNLCRKFAVHKKWVNSWRSVRALKCVSERGRECVCISKSDSCSLGLLALYMLIWESK